jgi:hypothetical protein
MPILFCEKCGHFSNLPPKDCVSTSNETVTIKVHETKCSYGGCTKPSVHYCRGNVRNVEHCGESFCESHVTFVQSKDRTLSGYQCLDCPKRQTNEELRIARKSGKKMRRRCFFFCPCLCPWFMPLECCLFYCCTNPDWVECWCCCRCVVDDDKAVEIYRKHPTEIENNAEYKCCPCCSWC